MISRWSDSVSKLIQSSLEAHSQGEDFRWEMILGFSQLPDQPPQPMVSVLLMTPNPILGSGDLLVLGRWPIAAITEQMLNAVIPEMIDGLGQARSMALAQDGQVGQSHSHLVVPGSNHN